jgi:hypothetical protein
MIDLKLIRDNPDKVSEALLKRGEDVDLRREIKCPLKFLFCVERIDQQTTLLKK